ncbi:MAG: aminopeptidase P N-terminal domain-containing protein [Flavobacteriales bacterium]|nr:aminopeptidase P N-terminal domain-containing protein [Flavobacteriales bacterium]
MANKIFLFCTCILFSFVSNAQDGSVSIASKTPELINLDYDTDLLTPEFFSKNRAALRQLMPTNSVAVFFANPIRNRSNDVDYEFHQDPNFYYLSGLREPHAVLLIFKETQKFGNGIATDELLFLQKRDASDEVWTGKRQGTEGAESFLGINKALTGAEFSSFETEFETFDKVFITELPEDVKNLDQKDDLFNIINSFKLKTEKAKLDQEDLKHMMAQLRQVKSEEEIILLKKAIEMTCDAQIELMKALKPGMTEYQSEAIVEYVFKKNGAEYPGFPSILGGGENSCILHYTSNRKPLKGNDLLVSDIGAEYHGYTADVTRTLPTDGVFSEEEKIIYNIVYEAQQAGIAKCKAGNKFWDPHNAATEIIAAKLMELGIIDKAYKVREYFMHGTSHYLGLDVHDAGLYSPLEKGNVITVEPGIYIAEGSDCDSKWWNIGVRIEDDILITDDEPITLSAKAPRTIEEIEALMKEKSKFE